MQQRASIVGVKKFKGDSPYRRESGDTVRRRGKMGKMGDRYLRKMLYMLARSACLRSRVFRDWAVRMMEMRHPKVVYSIMMRKLATYAYKVIKENQPFNPELVLKHRQLITVPWRSSTNPVFIPLAAIREPSIHPVWRPSVSPVFIPLGGHPQTQYSSHLTTKKPPNGGFLLCHGVIFSAAAGRCRCLRPLRQPCRCFRRGSGAGGW